MKKISLERGEYIFAVVPEQHMGHGWANYTVWVYIAKSDVGYRVEYLQPDDLSADMHALFSVGAAMCQALVQAVPTENGSRK